MRRRIKSLRRRSRRAVRGRLCTASTAPAISLTCDETRAARVNVMANIRSQCRRVLRSTGTIRRSCTSANVAPNMSIGITRSCRSRVILATLMSAAPRRRESPSPWVPPGPPVPTVLVRPKRSPAAERNFWPDNPDNPDNLARPRLNFVHPVSPGFWFCGLEFLRRPCLVQVTSGRPSSELWCWMVSQGLLAEGKELGSNLLRVLQSAVWELGGLVGSDSTLLILMLPAVDPGGRQPSGGLGAHRGRSSFNAFDSLACSRNAGIVVVDFGATYCGPLKAKVGIFPSGAPHW